MMKKLLPFVLFLLLAASKLLAQAPNISYLTPQVYTQGTAITALTPTNTGGAVPPVTLQGTYNNPRGLAVDASGNVFIAENGTSSVKEIPINGGSVSTLGSGFNAPLGVAVDGSGNIYVSDALNNAIKKIPAGNGAVVTIATGISTPYGIALDGHGFIYISEFGNNDVKKIPVGGGSAVVVGNGFSSPTGLALDASGNVYVADRGSNSIKEVKASDGSTITLANAYGNPTGVAVDGSGNVYFSDGSNTSVMKIAAGGGGISVAATGFSFPLSVTFDGHGDLYVGDGNTGLIKESSPAGSYSISPGLPAGLTINTQTGVITGTPTTGSPATNYTVTATNASGSGTATINITVNALPAPAISYTTPDVFTAGTAISPLSPTNTGGGVQSNGGYSITPALPSGLSLNTTTGVISGTPGGASPATDYTVTATNTSGSGTAVINITVNLPVPPAISYTTPDVFSATVAITPLSPTNTGGSVKANNGYSVSPALPSGLTLNVNTGVISGTPTAASPATDYTVKATNLGGSGTTTVNITVNPQPVPYITYTTPHVYTEGTAITALSPKNTGGAVSAGAVTTLTGGLNDPRGLAVDAAGNVYIAENGASQVRELLAGGGGLITLGSGFSHSIGVAVDGSGNVFVADYDNNAVKEIPAGNGPVVTVATGISNPYGIALDGHGYIYVSEFTGGDVKKIPVGGGAPVVIGTGFSSPTSIAIDASGNIYVADRGHNAIKQIQTNGSIVTLGTASSNPDGLSVDAAGNVYFADLNNGYIAEITHAGAGYTVISSGLSLPAGLAIDADGNLFVSDNNSQVQEIQKGGYSISPGLPLGLTFSNSTGIISGTPAAASPATNYVVTATNSGGSGSAVVNIKVNSTLQLSYATPLTFSAGFPINQVTPTSSGVGTGTAKTATNIGPLYSHVTGVAIDASGNVYAADNAANTITETPANGGANITLGSGFNTPTGVAVDASGNVYVADFGNNAVKEIPAGNGAVITLATGFNGPYSVSLDAAGNIYISDSGNNQVKKIPAGGGTPLVIGSNFVSPMGLAVDALGNVFVADQGTKTIKEIQASDGSTIVAYNAGGAPNGVALDNKGYIYISDAGASWVLAYNLIAATSYQITSVQQATAVGVNAANPDIIFAASGNPGYVYKIAPAGGYFISPALPAGLIFTETNGSISGTPTVASAATNYTVTAYNAHESISAVVNIAVVSSNTGLSNLTTSVSALSPGFSTPVTDYSINVDNSVTSLQLTPTASSPSYTITANNSAVTSGSPYTVTLNTNGLVTSVAIKVFSSGSQGIGYYTVTIHRAPSANDNLSALKLSNGTLSPAFAPGNTNYTATVGNAVSSITVTPSVSEAHATVKVNGTQVGLGSASAAIPLNVGANTISILVTAQDGTTAQTYTITVTRAASNDDNLISLSLSSGTLNPVFNASTVSYTASVSNLTSSIMVTPAADNPTATITVNGAAVASGSASAAIPLNVGSNTITVAVTASNGVSKKNYKVTVTRAIPTDILSGLKVSSGALSPAFAQGTTNYTVAVGNAVSSITVTPTAKYTGTSLTVNGTAVTSGSASPAISLNAGSNTISVVITGQDGAQQTYTITVTRATSGDDLLAGLSLSSGTLSPAFASGTILYSADVTNVTTSIIVTPTADNSTASITVNGAAVASGSASAGIPLNTGVNTITVAVTASNGVAKKNYTIKVNRAANPNVLSALKVSSGSLSPAFATSTMNYSVTVANSIASISVTPTATYSTSTITVNGTVTASGAASAAVPLNVGANAINIALSSTDNITQTYTVTVNRATSNDALLSNLVTSDGTLTPVFASATTSYTSNVANTTSSITVTPTTDNSTASVLVNGVAVPSGSASGAIALAVGSNTVSIQVKASNNVTTKTYTLIVTRASGGADAFDNGVSVSKPAETVTLADDGIKVHEGISPNGDGVNDFLVIENINQYPDNKLSVMNRNGQVVFEAKGYDNTSKVFDGRSNKSGQLQQPGTYFYQLDYAVNGIVKHKTGFIVLKY